MCTIKHNTVHFLKISSIRLYISLMHTHDSVNGLCHSAVFHVITTDNFFFSREEINLFPNESSNKIICWSVSVHILVNQFILSRIPRAETIRNNKMSSSGFEYMLSMEWQIYSFILLFENKNFQAKFSTVFTFLMFQPYLHIFISLLCN